MHFSTDPWVSLLLKINVLCGIGNFQNTVFAANAFRSFAPPQTQIPKCTFDDFFTKCFICFHMMIYGWKCHLGTLKGHLEPIFDIHDVIRAFSGKSIFFDFWAPKIFFLIFIDAEITKSAIFWWNFVENVFIYIVTTLEKKCRR